MLPIKLRLAPCCLLCVSNSVKHKWSRTGHSSVTAAGRTYVFPTVDPLLCSHYLTMFKKYAHMVSGYAEPWDRLQ